jgi:hypothetical protein
VAVDDATARVTALQAGVREAERQRLRAESDRDAAARGVEEASAALREEFGVMTPEQAREKLAELQFVLDTEIAAVQAALAGGPQ